MHENINLGPAMKLGSALNEYADAVSSRISAMNALNAALDELDKRANNPHAKKCVEIMRISSSIHREVMHKMKGIPKKKTHRNIFIKSYNRRPGNKKKTAVAMAGVLCAMLTGSSQIAMLQATPIPKFPHGSASVFSQTNS